MSEFSDKIIKIPEKEGDLSIFSLFASLKDFAKEEITSTQESRIAAKELYKRFIKSPDFLYSRDITILKHRLEESQSLLADFNPKTKSALLDWKPLDKVVFDKCFDSTLPTLGVLGSSPITPLIALVAANSLSMGKPPFNIIFIPDLSPATVRLGTFKNNEEIPYIQYGIILDSDFNVHHGFLPEPVPMELMLGAYAYTHREISALENSKINIPNSATGEKLASDKWESYKFLKEMGVPTPATIMLSRDDSGIAWKLQRVFNLISEEAGESVREVVLKPRNLSQGKGIVFFDNLEELGAAVLRSFQESESIIIQKRERSLPVLQKGRPPQEFCLRAIVDDAGISMVYARIGKSGYPINMALGASAVTIKELKRLIPKNLRNLMPDEDELKNSLNAQFIQIAKAMNCKRIGLDFIINLDGKCCVYEVNGENSGGENAYLGLKSKNLDALQPTGSFVESLSRLLNEAKSRHDTILKDSLLEGMSRLHFNELNTSHGLYKFLLSSCTYLAYNDPEATVKKIYEDDPLQGSFFDIPEWKKCLQKIEGIAEFSNIGFTRGVKEDIYRAIIYTYTIRQDAGILDILKGFPNEVQAFPSIKGSMISAYLDRSMLDEAKSLWNELKATGKKLREDICYQLLYACCEKATSAFGSLIASQIAKWYPESEEIKSALEYWEWRRDYFLTGVAVPCPSLKNS